MLKENIVCQPCGRFLELHLMIMIALCVYFWYPNMRVFGVCLDQISLC